MIFSIYDPSIIDVFLLDYDLDDVGTRHYTGSFSYLIYARPVNIVPYNNVTCIDHFPLCKFYVWSLFYGLIYVSPLQRGFVFHNLTLGVYKLLLLIELHRVFQYCTARCIFSSSTLPLSLFYAMMIPARSNSHHEIFSKHVEQLNNKWHF